MTFLCCCTLKWLVFSIGILPLTYFVFKCVKFLYTSKIRKSYDLVKRYGTGWCAITGATDGIGEALAFVMAKRGFNILLISRTEDKLQAVKRQITAQSNVMVDTLQVDLCVLDSEVEKTVKDKFQELEATGGLAVLFNNAGIFNEEPMKFHEMADAMVSDMLSVNVLAVNSFTKWAIPFMLKRKQNAKRGAIMMIGSVGGLVPIPFIGVYGASKSYVRSLAKALCVEYNGSGIDVQVCTPGLVLTRKLKLKLPRQTMAPSADDFAKLLCDQLGFECQVNPVLTHKITEFVMVTFPEILLNFLLRQGLKMLTSPRETVPASKEAKKD